LNESKKILIKHDNIIGKVNLLWKLEVNKTVLLTSSCWFYVVFLIFVIKSISSIRLQSFFLSFLWTDYF
jgi:hypothetical protein